MPQKCLQPLLAHLPSAPCPRNAALPLASDFVDNNRRETSLWWRQFRSAALLTLPVFLSEPPAPSLLMATFSWHGGLSSSVLCNPLCCPKAASQPGVAPLALTLKPDPLSALQLPWCSRTSPGCAMRHATPDKLSSLSLPMRTRHVLPHFAMRCTWHAFLWICNSHLAFHPVIFLPCSRHGVPALRLHARHVPHHAGRLPG